MLGRFFGRRAPMMDDGGQADATLGFLVRGGNVTPITTKGAPNIGKAVTGLYGIGLQAATRNRKELLATDDELAMAYASNVIAHRCVDLRSQKVAEMPYRIINRQTREVVKEHALLDALRNSDALHRKSLMYMWQSAKCIHGEAYLMKVTDTFGRPYALQWLNPTRTEPFVNQGIIQYFEYYDDARGYNNTKIPTWMIVYDYYHNPLDDLRGLSPMQVALEPVNVMNSVQAYQLAYFQNDATPGGLIGSKQGTIIQQSDQERMIKWWQEQLQGVRKRFRPLFMPFPLEWQNVQQPPSPEHTDIERAQIRKICDAFGVPVPLVDYDDQRYQRSEEHDKSFYENTIIPECEVVAKRINSDILPFFAGDDDVEFQFEYDKARALIDDQVKRTTSINARTMAGNLTINEARERFGDAPVEGGDKFFIPKAVLPVDKEELPSLDELTRPLPSVAVGQGGDPENAPMEALPANNGTTGTNVQDQALAELRAWRRKYKQKGLKGARQFVERYIPPRVADSLRSMLYALPDDAPTQRVMATFDMAQREMKSVLDADLIAGLAERIRESGIEASLEIRHDT